MRESGYSYLDLAVMSFLRRHVISQDAAVLFSEQIDRILWANAIGTDLFGGGSVGDLLDLQLSTGHPFVHQIANAVRQIESDQPIERSLRISRGLHTEMIQAELTRLTLPNGRQSILLICPDTHGGRRLHENELAEMTVAALEDFADASAIVDEFGLVLASSFEFDDMDIHPGELEKLVAIAAHEDDRLVKRPVNTGDNRIVAAGVGRVRDVPGRYLVVLADAMMRERAATGFGDARDQEPKQHAYADRRPEQTTIAPPAIDELQDDEAGAFARLPEDNRLVDGSDSDVERYQGEQEAPEAETFEPQSLVSAEPKTKETTAGKETPTRFAFTVDANQIILTVSPELADAVGSHSADIIGRHWREIAEARGFDRDGEILRLLEKADTWSGKGVLWPVDGADLAIPVDLAALPVFDRTRRFDGFRGFGMIRSADITVDPNAAGLARAECATTPDRDEESREISNKIPSENPDEDLSENPNKDQEDWRGGPSTWPGTERDADEATSASDAVVDPSKDGQEDLDEDRIAQTPVWQTPESEIKGASAGELVIDNVVQLPLRDDKPSDEGIEEAQGGEARGEKEWGSELGVEEQKTISQIKHARGGEAVDGAGLADMDNEQTSEKASAASTDASQASEAIENLPWPAVVYRAGETLFANEKLLQKTGYASIGDLRAAGGIEAILASDGENRDGFAQGLLLKSRGGETLPIRPLLKRVYWNGEKALCLTFGEQRQPGADGGGALDMVRISDLQNILETAADGIIVFDRTGKIESLNGSGEALFGRANSQVAGQSFTGLFAEESQKALSDYLDNLRNPGVSGGVSGILIQGIEIIAKEAGGGLIPLFVTIGAIGNSGRFCAVIRDLTEWKKSEEDLVKARRQAESASDQKSEFLSRISHEIREPLNSIIGFSDVMIDERFGKIDNPRYRGYLKDINRSGIHVLDLVNDLLDISKIEAGKLDLSYEAVDLNQLAAETVALAQPQANDQRIIIRTSLSRAVPKVVADARSIRQIILNLVSNAIRHSPRNSQVIVSTAYEENGEVGLRIRDTGQGMTTAELEQALEPFAQVGEDRAETGGTGLGLPLTKALVEANRAYFELESTVGEGTIAHIQFPSQRVLAD